MIAYTIFVQNNVNSIYTFVGRRIDDLKVICERILNKILQMIKLFTDVLEIAIRP
jgi:hypothetical protein